MLLLEYVGCGFLFAVIALGLAWLLVDRLALDPAEKLVVTVALSLLGIFGVAWSVFVWSLPPATLWCLPALAVLGLVLRARSFAAVLRDPSACGLLAAQSIVTLWGAGCLALVVTYSGGEWIGDWYGHLQRTWFFLDHWPRETLFNGFDALTTRPPLANIVNGALLTLTQRNFAHYQLASTLLGSIAFLPAALLARRFSSRSSAGVDPRMIAVLAVLFMLNPLWVQNEVYAWTKLPAAFFTLTALYFFLRAHDPASPASAGPLFAVSLAGGILTHYSTGPYAVLLGLAWLALGWRRRSTATWWRATTLAALAGLLVLTIWFGWALAVYGVRGTFLTNTSVADQAPTLAAQLGVAAFNLRDTLVPHFLRATDFGVFAQSSPWGWWRDWFFQLYQANLFFAFGSTAWLVILANVMRDSPGTTRRNRGFWTAFCAGAVVLGVGVHAARNPWGLVHICLQPFILLGLAYLAARWSTLSLGWRRVGLAGATLDFFAGIALQAGAQGALLDRWFTPQRPVNDALATYSNFAQVNLRAKLDNHWVFFGDHFSAHTALVIAGLAALLAIAVFRAANPRPAK